MSEADNIAKLAAELNGHNVTDEQGDVTESETVGQESAPAEQTTVDESTNQAEKPAESDKPAPQAEETDEETPVEDETGKRYVPEKRFKDIYAKAKAAERELAELKKQQEIGQEILNTTSKKGGKIPDTSIPVDKADLLEVKMAYPQLNPKNLELYDQDLDEDAGIIWRAAHGNLSPMQAAEQAIEKRAKLEKRIASQISGVKTEARLIKTQQSDRGITSKVISRSGTQPNPDQMSDKELEAFLKANGQW